MAEPDVRLISDYSDAIAIMRNKGYTFREIAEWLGKNCNIEADHNAVYRAYTKGLSEEEAAIVANEEEEDERNAS